jgi:hypothetical protein
MIAEARRLAPDIELLVADLAGLDLARTFDVVVLAGNVPIFCPEQSRDELIGSCAAHVRAGGVLIVGFQLGRGYELEELDASCREAELVLEERWKTWDRVPFDAMADYAVSVLRRPGDDA